MRRVVLLVVFGLLLGGALTAGAGALPGSQDLNALTWLGTVSTVAALVVAVGIFHVQQAQSDAAHQELLDVLKAQDEILEGLADATPSSEAESPSAAPDALSAAQREAIEARFGDQSIETAWAPGGRPDNPTRLVRLRDGTLVTVYPGRRGGGPQVRQVRPRGERGRSPRSRRSRGSESG